MFTPGQSVTWMYTPPGGYGYVQPVPATVVRLTAKRVFIRVLKYDGTWVERAVKPERLRVYAVD